MIQFISKNKGIVNAMINHLNTANGGNGNDGGGGDSRATSTDVLAPSQPFHLMMVDEKCRSLLTFDNKRKYFLTTLKKTARSRNPATGGEIPVNVRRTHILEDSFHVLSDLPSREMYFPLNIRYENEAGVDAGRCLVASLHLLTTVILLASILCRRSFYFVV